ncbi:Protein of unknown function (DUF3326) [Synechococcus sp. PCC 7502]|uniref:DUF3326 domain-containing protein n=1 Tax=Synechococcus sp. PCC 7502 TaxID=1173263 RepID=UPI00029FA098|nr:DUF3326 domain-containing protein [Synechococcus sp. PCC 7502]AFY72945.1 Protein of unknown function (DUF3326) [Synechococcus sp. PCC 7502]
MTRSLTVLLIIPTGIKAAIGGYAGDALPVARAIAAVADTVITHPNVLNGASLFYPMPNVLYVEGYGLDQVALGNWGLQPVHSNRIGVILDRGIEPELELRHRQAIAAAQATLGLTITDTVITDQNLGVELQIGKSGATWGTIAHPDSLLRAADYLVNVCKVQAIAVITRFPDDTDSLALQNYRQGRGVDALAGAEAVISHLLVREFAIPTAHAPALSPLPLDPSVSARAAAEELGYTFLPCVLVGLSKAPQFITTKGNTDLVINLTKAIARNHIDVIITPESACGGTAILALQKLNHIHYIFVRENTTALQVYPQMLGLTGTTVNGYLEAIGVLAAIKAGVNPQALRC